MSVADIAVFDSCGFESAVVLDQPRRLIYEENLNGERLARISCSMEMKTPQMCTNEVPLADVRLMSHFRLPISCLGQLSQRLPTETGAT